MNGKEVKKGHYMRTLLLSNFRSASQQFKSASSLYSPLSLHIDVEKLYRWKQIPCGHLPHSFHLSCAFRSLQMKERTEEVTLKFTIQLFGHWSNWRLTSDGLLLLWGEELGVTQTGQGEWVGLGGHLGSCESAHPADQCREQKLQYRYYYWCISKTITTVVIGQAVYKVSNIRGK